MHNNKTEAKASRIKKYIINVDGIKVKFDEPIVTGEEILAKVGKVPVECFALYQKFKGCDFEKIEQTEDVDLSEKGIERFTVKEAETYYYLLDEEPETSEKKLLSANEIMQRGGLKPVTDYYLIELTASGDEISHRENPKEPIELRCPGSKFVSIYDGEVPVS